jgi:AraC-like DNA-binding protein
MVHQVNLFLLSMGALQGGLLSWYLLRKQKAHRANTYFVLILMVAGLQLTFKVMSKVWLMENYLFPYLMSYHLPFLMGPLLFLYIRARVSMKFRKMDLLHFIPFVFTISTIVLQYYYPADFRYLGFSAYGRAAWQLISLGLYGYFAWRLIQKEKELKPLKSFLIGLVCGEFIIVVTLAVMYVYYGRFPDVRLLFVALTLFIYWISYKQLEHPQLFIVYEQQPTLQMQVQSHAKYNHSSLKAEEAGRIASLLQQAMHQQRLYLDSDLSIDLLAQKLDVSRHHISQVLNERFQMTYSDYVNDLRLAEAKSRLQNTRYNHFTVAAIAMDSGFNSVSNFNDLFKKKFGKTPSSLRTDLAENRGKMTA